MDLNNRLITLEMENNALYEIFLHEINKKIGEKNNSKILTSVRKGMKVDFSFEDFIKERFTRQVYKKVVKGKEVGEDIPKIKISGKEILEKDFEDEILERVRLMRGWIWENMAVEKIGELRGSGGEDES